MVSTFSGPPTPIDLVSPVNIRELSNKRDEINEIENMEQEGREGHPNRISKETSPEVHALNFHGNLGKDNPSQICRIFTNASLRDRSNENNEFSEDNRSARVLGRELNFSQSDNSMEHIEQKESSKERRRREEEESEALARQLMEEEALASYHQSTNFLRQHAEEYSADDLAALEAAMAEEEPREELENVDEEGMLSSELSYETLLQLGERIGDVKTERWTMRAKEEIEKLPLKIFNRDMAEGKDENDSSVKCLVCQFPFEDGEQIRILPCQHHFHNSCVDQWLMQKDHCPYCRQSIVGE